MVCLGIEPRAAGWKAQMNPLNYSGTPTSGYFTSISAVQEVVWVPR